MKTIHPRRVLNNKNHIRLGGTRQFIYSVSTQQRVSAQRPSSDRKEDK